MKNKKNTKTWKILEFIGSKKEGVGLTEIQHFIWTKLDGYTEESFWRKEKTYGWSPKRRSYPIQLRATRGHWCTALYGGCYYHTGLLHEYCKKVGKKWVLDHMPNPKETIYKYPKFKQRGYYWNRK